MKIVKTSGSGEISINFTNMIDIIFNLLIFFVLTAQFKTLEIEEVNLPYSATAEPKEYQDQQNLVVNIVHPEAPVVVVGGEEISDADLTRLLIERRDKAKELNVTLNVILRTDARVAYADAARVMLAVGRAESPGWWIETDISDARKAEQEWIEGKRRGPE